MAKRKTNSRSRGYSPRKVNTRSTRQRFLIVCEGKETEPNYFRSFRVPKDVIEIDVQGLAMNPSQLVQEAQNLRNTDSDYDQVWCVFDRDSWPIQDFNNALTTAKKQKIKVAYSNEAFELWYILHFQYLNTGISRKDYGRKLTKLLGYEYEKNSDTMYDRLIELQDKAIKNAESLLCQYQPPNPSNDNPSTTVHLLVKELNKFIR